MQLSISKNQNRLIKLPISNLIIFILIVIDQLSKFWLIENLNNHQLQPIEITKFFNLVHVWNHGISFGLFEQYQQYSSIVFIILNLLITLYLYKTLIVSKSTFIRIALCLIIGGAIGNIIDRLVYGAVFDFLHFHYNNYSFPIFNLADCFISSGGAAIIYDYYNVKKFVAEVE